MQAKGFIDDCLGSLQRSDNLKSEWLIAEGKHFFAEHFPLIRVAGQLEHDVPKSYGCSISSREKDVDDLHS